MKRKSDDNPAMAASGDDVSGSKKRQKVGDEDSSVRPSKKEKKASKDKKFKTEKLSKKDRKLKEQEEYLDLPLTDANPEGDVESKDDTAAKGDAKPAKSGSADKKAKREKKKNKTKEEDAVAAEATLAGTEERSKSKKGNKPKNANKEQIVSQRFPADPSGEDGDDATAAAAAATEEEGNKSSKKHRFVVFVGNLPFSATTADIEKHFAAVHPTSVRLLHQKADPKKSRGVAFVEFAGYDHMKTCLKTMHHSTFTCEGRDYRGQPKQEERKINVELPTGGGGNTEFRKDKIRAKNEKLQGERERRAAEEHRQKLKKERERLAKGGQQKSDENGVHPSRRGIVPGTDE